MYRGEYCLLYSICKYVLEFLKCVFIIMPNINSFIIFMELVCYYILNDYILILN